MSHVGYDIVFSVLSKIDAEYENIAKMTITRGKTHKFPRMTIDYYSLGKVNSYMIELIGNIMNATPE